MERNVVRPLFPSPFLNIDQHGFCRPFPDSGTGSTETTSWPKENTTDSNPEIHAIPPQQRQPVTQVPGDVPPQAAPGFPEQAVVNRRKRVEPVSEPGHPLLKVTGRHLSGLKNCAYFPVILVPVRCQESAFPPQAFKEGRPGHGDDNADGSAGRCRSPYST